MYKPEILALLEPHTSGEVADSVCTNIGRRNWFRVEAVNFIGGIWLLWDSDMVDLRIIHAHKRFVHLLVTPDTLEEGN